MGATYAVTLKIKLKDEEAFIRNVNAFIEELESTNQARFGTYYDRTTVDGLVQNLITDRNYTKWEDGLYDSAFDASYGWEWVMCEAFDHMAEVLEDGSFIDIFPDSGEDYGEVINGKVKWTK